MPKPNKIYNPVILIKNLLSKIKKDDFSYNFSDLIADILTFKRAKQGLISILVLIFAFVSAYLTSQWIPATFYSAITSIFVKIPFLWVLGVLLLMFTVIILFKSVLFNKYRLSIIQFNIFLFIFAFYVVFRYYLKGTDSEILCIYKTKIEFLDLFFYVGIIGFSISFIRTFFKSFKKLNEHPNYFLEDNPLKSIENNDHFENLFNKLKPALFHDCYETAFSIGILGQWGTGKSSFIKEVERKIEHQIKTLNQEILYISFSPFLNHNEDQVIHEFFTQLSNVLKSRNGKLSNLLLNYSERLSNIIKDKNAFSFLKPVTNHEGQKSTKELYDDIYKIIFDLNYKIIVSIDDLDRLNGKEILQVLKLIRNTSNFPNMIFLVAMDKEYVSLTLNKEQSIINKRFLDKFFQLEIQLPPNENQKLVSFFSNCLEKTDAIQLTKRQESLLKEISKVFSENQQIVNLYIKNYRDVISIVNLIKKDIDFLERQLDNIDLTDYLVISLIKRKFPEIYNVLLTDRSKLLKEINTFVDRDFILMDDLHSEDYEGHNKLILRDDFVDQLKKISENSFDEEIIFILNQTFNFIFQYKDKNPNSIIFIENFLLLIHENAIKELFSTNDLIELIQKNDKNQIEHVINGDLFPSFERRIQSYEPENKEKLIELGKFLFLLRDLTTYNTDNLLKKFFNVEHNSLNSILSVPETANFIKDTFLLNKKFIVEDKVHFLSKQVLKDSKLNFDEEILLEFAEIIIDQVFEKKEEYTFTRIANVLFELNPLFGDSKRIELLKLFINKLKDEFQMFFSLFIDFSNSKSGLVKIDNDYWKAYFNSTENIDKFLAIFSSLKITNESKSQFIKFINLCVSINNSFPFRYNLDQFNSLKLEEEKEKLNQVHLFANIDKSVNIEQLINVKVTFNYVLKYQVFHNEDGNKTIFLSININQINEGIKEFMTWLMNQNKSPFGSIYSSKIDFKQKQFSLTDKNKKVFDIIYISE